MKRVAVIVVNYRTPELAIAALASLETQFGPSDVAIVVDNDSRDDSVDRIAKEIAERDWSSWAKIIQSGHNGGFAFGNNIGFRAVEAEFYLLLNSDAQLRPRALKALLAAAARHPRAGVIGPRLEALDGSPQHSVFRRPSPLAEFIDAAATGFLSRLLQRWTVPLGVPESALACDWLSFACVLIRREALAAVGGLDEAYFMYFEDAEFCLRAAEWGFEIVHDPEARVVHLSGASSSVKERAERRSRQKEYFYRSRSRFFATFYGRGGLFAANLLWNLGRLVSLAHEISGRRTRHVSLLAWRDIWIGAFAALPPRQRALSPGTRECTP